MHSPINVDTESQTVKANFKRGRPYLVDNHVDNIPPAMWWTYFVACDNDKAITVGTQPRNVLLKPP